MEMEKKMFFVAVVFAFAAEAAMAIKCYQCEYEESMGITAGMANCKDEFKAEYNMTIVNDPITGDPCAFCTKTKTSHDNTDTVFYDRACSSLQATDDCGSGEYGGGETYLCSCKTDLCNSGNDVMMSFGANAFAAFAYLL
ncbi:uncharacterized protein LOC128239772 [Mya arenaria]|uniref:uncharacterized protein LOC128239772 n=1 Tax=Mya arenaria TaxID=6604 RepID=UPI0022E30B51|nr:uncharacterized protein LOC128239772 [Mya arenaria]